MLGSHLSSACSGLVHAVMVSVSSSTLLYLESNVFTHASGSYILVASNIQYNINTACIACPPYCLGSNDQEENSVRVQYRYSYLSALQFGSS